MRSTNTLLAAIGVPASVAALRKAPIENHVIQVLIGLLLGDAHASRSSTSSTRIEWSFGQPYFYYAQWLYIIVAMYCNTGLKMLP